MITPATKFFRADCHKKGHHKAPSTKSGSTVQASRDCRSQVGSVGLRLLARRCRGAAGPAGSVHPRLRPGWFVTARAGFSSPPPRPLSTLSFAPSAPPAREARSQPAAIIAAGFFLWNALPWLLSRNGPQGRGSEADLDPVVQSVSEHAIRFAGESPTGSGYDSKKRSERQVERCRGNG